MNISKRIFFYDPYTLIGAPVADTLYWRLSRGLPYVRKNHTSILNQDRCICISKFQLKIDSVARAQQRISTTGRASYCLRHWLLAVVEICGTRSKYRYRFLDIQDTICRRSLVGSSHRCGDDGVEPWDRIWSLILVSKCGGAHEPGQRVVSQPERHK